jgi:hypothetical protein
MSLALLPLSLVGFFLALRFVSYQDFLGVSRYYEPVSLCIALVSYDLASRRTSHWSLRIAASLVVLALLLYLVAYFPALALLDRRQAELTKTVLGYTPSNSTDRASTSVEVDWPGARIYSLKEGSREALRQLSARHPEAVFFLANHAFYVYEYDQFRRPDGAATVDLRRMPQKGFFAHAYTSRPLKVFWVLETSTPTDFLPGVGSRLVYSDPVEKTAIYESDLPAGYRFSAGSSTPAAAREYDGRAPGGPDEGGLP